MSPKSYGFLWIFIVTTAGFMWVAGVFTVLMAIVFGFIAFGMTFMGMMCVLPSAVSHPAPEKTKLPVQKTAAPKKAAPATSGLSAYRAT